MLGKQSFLKGAVILTAAGIGSRLIGAFFRIALAAMITDEGIGLYQMAYPIYIALLTLSTAGIPLAVSKLVSEKLAVNNYHGALRVFRVSLILLSFSGFIISLALFWGAEFILNGIVQSKDSRALVPLMSIAPAIFFVAIMATFRGFFQGQQNMVPTGVSQVIEQLTRVAMALFLAAVLLPYGLEYSAAGATFGAVVGAFFSLLYLVYLYFKQKPAYGRNLQKYPELKPDNLVKAVYGIATLAIPITLGNLVLPFISVLDLAIVPQRLHVAGFSIERATALYGQLTGMAAPLSQIPVIITMSLAVSLVPSISEALAVRNMESLNRNVSMAIRLTFILGLPAALGLYILAGPITVMLFNNVEAAVPVRLMALSVVFVTLYQTTTGILQGMGRPMLPVINILIGALVKVVLGWYLTAIPEINIQGAALATVLGFLISALLNTYFMSGITGFKMNYIKYLGKPIVSTGAMGLAAYYAYYYLYQLFRNFYALSLSNTLATLLSISIGAVVFGVMLFVTGCITREDLQDIPKIGTILVKVSSVLNISRG